MSDLEAPYILQEDGCYIDEEVGDLCVRRLR